MGPVPGRDAVILNSTTSLYVDVAVRLHFGRADGDPICGVERIARSLWVAGVSNHRMSLYSVWTLWTCLWSWNTPLPPVLLFVMISSAFWGLPSSDCRYHYFPLKVCPSWWRVRSKVSSYAQSAGERRSGRLGVQMAQEDGSNLPRAHGRLHLARECAPPPLPPPPSSRLLFLSSLFSMITWKSFERAILLSLRHS